MKEEIWKDIYGFNGKYQVSNFGRIKSLIGWNGKKYIQRTKILKLVLQNVNIKYKRYVVRMGGKNYRVHQIVAQAFIPNTNNYKVVNHKDFNALNNKMENLEWCSQEYNIKYSVIHERNKCYYKYDKEKATNMFIKGYSAKYIGMKLGVPEYIVQGMLQKNHIKRNRSDGLGKYNVSANNIRKFIKQNKSAKEIAEALNIPSNYVSVLKYKLKKES